MQVPEDYPVEEPVYVVHAEDEDRGDNAELSYILETSTQLQYGQIFRLHRNTGEVCTFEFCQCMKTFLGGEQGNFRS